MAYEAQLTIAQCLLDETFGTGIAIIHAENLTPDRNNHLVMRLDLSGVNAPTHILLKYIDGWGKHHFDEEHTSDWYRLCNDYAGCVFLSKYLPDLVPRAYAIAPQDNLMLIEYLAHDGHSVVEPLLENTPEVHASLRQVMQLLGQMHAATIGKVKEYETLRASIDSVPVPDRVLYAGGFKRQVPELRAKLAETGFQLSAEAEADLLRLCEKVAHPHPDFLGYIHRDPCPDNYLFVGGAPRLIDFESSSFSNVLLDAVYPRMMFPTCWCAGQIPNAIVEDLEAIYRAELVKGCPSAADDTIFYEQVVEACAVWLYTTLLIKMFWRGNFTEDAEWGIATHHQRILSRLIAFAEIAEHTGTWLGLAHDARKLHQHFSALWQIEGLATYPAFGQ